MSTDSGPMGQLGHSGLAPGPGALAHPLDVVAEDGHHVDVLRVEQPLHLKSVDHGDDLSGQRLTVDVRADLSGLDSGLECGRQVCTSARVAFPKPVPGRVSITHALAHQYSESLNQAWRGGVAPDELHEAIKRLEARETAQPEACAVDPVSFDEHCGQQLLLAWVVMQQASGGQAGVCGDLRQRRALVAVEAESLQGRAEHTLPCRGASTRVCGSCDSLSHDPSSSVMVTYLTVGRRPVATPILQPTTHGGHS